MTSSGVAGTGRGTDKEAGGHAIRSQNGLTSESASANIAMSDVTGTNPVADPAARILSGSQGAAGPRSTTGEDLVELMHCLLEAGGCTRISLADRAHHGLVESLARITLAASDFRIRPDLALREILWTNPRHVRDGTMAAQLKALAARFEPSHPWGYALLWCTDASARSLFWMNAGPLSFPCGIDGDRSAGGPYLVLVLSQLDPAGRIVFLRSVAQAVASSALFMPVKVPSERTLIETLLGVQDRLDNHGWDMVIERLRHGSDTAPRYMLTASAPDGRVRRCAVDWHGATDGHDIASSKGISAFAPLPKCESTSHFAGGLRDLASGRLVKWLRDEIVR